MTSTTTSSSSTAPLLSTGLCVTSSLTITAVRLQSPTERTRYQELLTAVLTRDGARPRVRVTGIWVDSEVSMAGGRALWGIPKEMATFEVHRARLTSFAARTDEGELAAGRNAVRRHLPGRRLMAYKLAQTADGRIKTSPVRSSAALRLADAEWTAPAGSVRSAVEPP
ncbi:acetoacetate decarboxylase family protein [Streptomyces sp. NPDC001068]|uniref:acetoacetate decarboxylase family protein n=1 Tax=Streptomyces sp. NPDC001068 TaxID=3364544 RepID=UPI00368D9ADC